MRIELRYKPLNSVDWTNFSIGPEGYFERTSSDGPHEWDDTPAYLKLADYLPVPKSQLSQIELKIWDPDERLQLTSRSVFWNGGRNEIIWQIEEGLELWIVQIMLDGRPIVWHTVRLNCYADGGLLLEHLQTIETDGRQTPGPSESVSLSAAGGDAENGTALAWRHGSLIVKRDGNQSTSMILQLQTLEDPATWQEIRLLLAQDGGGLLEHSQRILDDNREDDKLIVRQSL